MFFASLAVLCNGVDVVDVADAAGVALAAVFVVLVGAPRDASGIGPLVHRFGDGNLGAAAFVILLDVLDTVRLDRRVGDDSRGCGVDTVLPEVGVDVGVAAVVGDDGNAGEEVAEYPC